MEIWRWNQRGFTIVDALITLCLIGVLIGIVIPKYQRVALEAQKSALRAELVNIRTGIRLFKMVNGRCPKSLREMAERDVIIPARIGADAYTGSVFEQKYLTSYAVDSAGNMLDPFGSPFEYDPLRGEVKATTKGYEKW